MGCDELIRFFDFSHYFAGKYSPVSWNRACLRSRSTAVFCSLFLSYCLSSIPLVVSEGLQTQGYNHFPPANICKNYTLSETSYGPEDVAQWYFPSMPKALDSVLTLTSCLSHCSSIAVNKHHDLATLMKGSI